jgi:hypothetical protein
MNQSGSTVLALPVERQVKANVPALVGLFRLPELTGPHRTRLPNSYAPNSWPGRYTTKNVGQAPADGYRSGVPELGDHERWQLSKVLDVGPIQLFE